MTIQQRFEIPGHPDYVFNVTIQSLSEHAHSLMSDEIRHFELHLQGFCSGLQTHPLLALVKIHKEGKV